MEEDSASGSDRDRDEVIIEVAWQPGMRRIEKGDLCTAYLENGAEMHAIITEVTEVDGGLTMKAIKDWTDSGEAS